MEWLSKQSAVTGRLKSLLLALQDHASSVVHLSGQEVLWDEIRLLGSWRAEWCVHVDIALYRCSALPSVVSEALHKGDSELGVNHLLEVLFV